jgi:hypothetical protein
MKIAVFVDKYGTVLPFFSSGVFEIYADENGTWKCINQVAMNLGFQPSIKEILRNIRMLVTEFDGCNLLVVEDVQGIVRSYLSDFQIGIWKFKGVFLEENLLNHIKLEVEKEVTAQAGSPVHQAALTEKIKDLEGACALLGCAGTGSCISEIMNAQWHKKR